MNRSVVPVMVASLLLVGCIVSPDDDDDGSDTAAATSGEAVDESGEESGEAQMRTLRWDFTGLPDLGADYVYEGWVIVGGDALTAGRFSVDADGVPDVDAFEFSAADADGATKYVLTIEPAVDDPPAPSKVHLVAGVFEDGAADLVVEDGQAIGTNFHDAGGSFFLETPTSEEGSDYANGIWWLDPSGGPSLNLPELAPGWTYEGWVVGDDGPVSTGTFRVGNDADSDGAGPTAGPLGSPSFPGQDFIDPPVTLTGFTAVISVEPDPDNGPEPFVLKPLVAMSIEDVRGLQAMDNNAEATNPTGMAWFE